MKNMESLIDKVFQSTLPRRERLSFLVFLLHQKLFQSTLPRRERQDREKMIHVCDNFNPRSREGSDRIETYIRNLTAYFNPRSREGSDSKYAQFFIMILAYLHNIITYFLIKTI